MSVTITPIFRPSGSSGINGVPSGSFALGIPTYWDVSQWSSVQVHALAQDGIAGTASVYVASVPYFGGDVPNSSPYTPFATLLQLAVPESTNGVDAPTTSSITPICAKWMGIDFTATSGSTSSTTGSAFITLTLR